MKPLFFYILGPDGEPQAIEDVVTWAKWFEANHEARHLEQTTIDTTGTWISTIFLGLDHSFSNLVPGGPILFETMVFGGPCDQEMDRYGTRAEAMHGHAAMVARVMEREARAEETANGH
jgi:hypothetical protein